jgi:alkanesulfonate monooxygenase SsuD/methylene tetrahydromethanopterin reductase-like flavin-dependent oxidoreductase (luciferase family)
MRIGIIIGLHGREGEAPGWTSVRDQVRAAEAVGFDLAVIEDALLYSSDEGSEGYWESVAMAGAMAAATSRIEIGHSVINAPYRSAALTAKIAETLDEISGGRFFLGIGLGNTPDYEQFGMKADHRFSRFAETIQIVHSLLKTGEVDHGGVYQSARGAKLVPRGPRPNEVPIIIAGKGPKMLRLTARYADGWNWWSVGAPDLDVLRPIVADLERACDEVGRDSPTLRRTLDFYSVDPLGTFSGPEEATGGTPTKIAEAILRFEPLGFDEVRVNVYPTDSVETLPAAIEALQPVVDRVHAGGAR